MGRNLLMAALLAFCAPAHADRISRMNATELCTYTAQLHVAAYYYFEQGRRREDIQLKWHGDETQNEIDFVNKTVADAYAWLEAWKANGSELLPPQSYGDMIYQSCMSRKES